MGCNCKVNEKIFKINKNYGFQSTVNVSERILFKVRETIKLILLLPITLIALPILIAMIPIVAIKGKGNVNINKMLNLLLRKNRK